MKIVLTLLAILLLLVISELWWRRRDIHNELSRKFVHLSVGTLVAFWPFYLSRLDIELLSLAFVVVVVLSKRFHVFNAIHSVQRPTWGEVYFALSVGIIALVTNNKWIYLAALLQMSVADGLAAVIGVRYGVTHKYLVFRRVKSLAGTSAFLIASLLILTASSHYGHLSLGAAQIVIISLAAGLLENIGIDGLDNILVPLFVAVALIK